MKTTKLWGSMLGVMIAPCLLPINAIAQMDRGNGGNALVCSSDPDFGNKVAKQGYRVMDDQLESITSIEALDLIDARAQRVPIVTDAQFSAKTPFQFADRIFKRMEHLHPNFYRSFYQNVYEHFKRNVMIRYYRELGMSRIFDEDLQKYARDGRCTVVTIVRQTDVNGSAILDIDKELFEHDKHTEESQNVFFAHESLLRFHLKHTNVVSTAGLRNVLSVLMRKEMSLSVFENALTSAGWRQFAKSIWKFNDDAPKDGWQNVSWADALNELTSARFKSQDIYLPTQVLLARKFAEFKSFEEMNVFFNNWFRHGEKYHDNYRDSLNLPVVDLKIGMVSIPVMELPSVGLIWNELSRGYYAFIDVLRLESEIRELSQQSHLSLKRLTKSLTRRSKIKQLLKQLFAAKQKLHEAFLAIQKSVVDRLPVAEKQMTEIISQTPAWIEQVKKEKSVLNPQSLQEFEDFVQKIISEYQQGRLMYPDNFLDVLKWDREQVSTIE